jgi:hypothetical protein
MGHRLQQFLPFGRIIDLGEFLRQIQVIPADDAILDEPFNRGKGAKDPTSCSRRASAWCSKVT